MKLRNKIVNYFVVPLVGSPPQVMRSPVTMNAETAKSLICKQFKKDGKEVSVGPILHVCYDYDSKIIYVPNAEQFGLENRFSLITIAKHRIVKDFGNFSSRPIIEGSPFSSLRVRSLNSFSHAKKIIEEYCQESKTNAMPIIEVNLERMPSTLKTLPSEYREFNEFIGSYIDSSFASSISFVDEIDLNGKKRGSPILLLNQKTPFILINIAKTSKREEPTANEKEWIVLSGYRDHLCKRDGKPGIQNFADLYAIKRHLYLGWSFEEVCSLFMGSASNVGEFIIATDRLMSVSDSLVKEGYKNLSAVPYYISFKIGSDFPLNLTKLIGENGRIKTDSQYRNFVIVDFDTSTDYVLIKTPIYIDQNLCKKIFNAKSKPIICRYNSVVNRIDIKGDSEYGSCADDDRRQLNKIFSMVSNTAYEETNHKELKRFLQFRSGALASGKSATDPSVYNKRRISDYLYASDFIKKMCKKYGVEFTDFDVVVGPIESSFGAGVQGGYADYNLFIKNKWAIPTELSKGVFISPPVIFINSVTSPSYAQQTDTLIHEYRHFIYGLQNPNYQVTYKSPKNSEDYEAWFNYLNDKNEKAAHRDQIEFELGLGKSYDEIIRDKVGGMVTTENYPIAIQFAELVQEVVKEIEGEDANEEFIG